MRRMTLALLTLMATTAHAATPKDAWSGTYTTCGETEGAAWRLTAQGKGYAVAYRASGLEDWKPDATVAQELSPADLARLNATGSSKDPKDQAQAALAWQGGHLLRMAPGWFDRYRRPGQGFTPDLVFTGDGQAAFFCKAK